jgi:tetratricopeptide (TPR) repeat protein
VCRESLALRRQLVERLGGTPESLRDLSVSLDNVGGVAQAQGDWTEAESVYRESLALRRQLVERLGGTPESLRDLSVSLDNLGRVAQAQGDWTQAESVYRESLALRRQLVERLGGTPESLRDLSVSLNNSAAWRRRRATGLRPRASIAKAWRSDASSSSGSAARRSRCATCRCRSTTSAAWRRRRATGRRPRAVYRESLALSRQLVERLGGTPESLRDLSVSLNNLGRVAQAQDEWTQADAICRESLALSRQVVERLGGTPVSLRDLSVSLHNLGRVARGAGRLDAGRGGVPRKPGAQTPAGRAARRHAGVAARPVGLARQPRPRGAGAGRLDAGRVGAIAKAWRSDASWSSGSAPRRSRCATCRCRSTTSAAWPRRRATGRRPRASYRESLALSRQLVERLGGTPESLDDLAVSLLNLAGRPGGDPAAGAEAAEIYRLLASRFPSTVRFVHQLQRLSAKLDGPVN